VIITQYQRYLVFCVAEMETWGRSTANVAEVS